MWPNPQFHADLVTFTEEVLNGKHDFLCIVLSKNTPEDNVIDDILGVYLI